jgi:hypothetical protein
MLKKTTQPLRERLMNLFVSSTKGELNDATSMVIDKSKMQDWCEISIALMALLCETANEDIKVITQFSTVGNKEKFSTQENSELLQNVKT